MRRAFVGTSSPVGYGYKYNARKTKNDLSSSPNPLLFGSTGLMILYDEIWFPCASFCPDNMRDLPYVKFLDRDAPLINIMETDFKIDQEELFKLIGENTIHKARKSWNDAVGASFDPSFLQNGAVDNHTHGIEILGAELGGNCDLRHLISDTWMIAQYPHLDLDLVLNPLSADFGLAVYGGEGEPVLQFSRLELTEALLRIDQTVDLAQPEGPYHPCLEELREDTNLKAFRQWMDGVTTRLDNQEIRTIEQDVNATIRDFTKKSIRKYVKSENLFSVLIDRTKSSILGLVPPAATIARVLEMRNKNIVAKKLGWQAFIATSRLVEK